MNTCCDSVPQSGETYIYYNLSLYNFLYEKGEIKKSIYGNFVKVEQNAGI
jgi:hypothetical protein